MQKNRIYAAQHTPRNKRQSIYSSQSLAFTATINRKRSIMHLLMRCTAYSFHPSNQCSVDLKHNTEQNSVTNNITIVVLALIRVFMPFRILEVLLWDLTRGSNYQLLPFCLSIDLGRLHE